MKITTIERIRLYDFLKKSDLANQTAQELATLASAELGFPVRISSVAYMRRQMGIKPKLGRPSRANAKADPRRPDQ